MSYTDRCPDCKGALHETGNEAEDGWRCPRCDRYVSAYELLTAADARIRELERELNAARAANQGNVETFVHLNERIRELENKLRATQITGEKVTLISEDSGPFRCVTCGVEPERVRQMAAELERLHGILDGRRSGDDDGPPIPHDVLEAWAKDCRCCPECNESPCGGVQQGGPCDEMPCRCEDDDDGEYDDEDDCR